MWFSIMRLHLNNIQCNWSNKELGNLNNNNINKLWIKNDKISSLYLAIFQIAMFALIVDCV